MKLLGWVVVLLLGGCATDDKGIVGPGGVILGDDPHEETACEVGAWTGFGATEPPMCEAACATRETEDRSKPCDGATNAKHDRPLKCFSTFSVAGVRGCCNVDTVLDDAGAPTATDVVFYACP